jgi:hypothetical protein
VAPTPRVEAPRPYAPANGAARVAASGASPATEAEPATTGIATAVAPAPPRPLPVAPSSSVSPIGAPAGRALEERMVQMSGLRRGSVGPRALLVVGLCALIAGAVWFVLTQVL